MSEQDDRLENFIRKGLKEPEFTFREEDWALMEAKLDVMPVPVSSWVKIKWWFLGTMLIFISFFSGWLFNDWVYNKPTENKSVILSENNTFVESDRIIQKLNNKKENKQKEEVGDVKSIKNTKAISSIEEPLKQPENIESQSKIKKTDFKFVNLADEPRLITNETRQNIRLLNYQPWNLKELNNRLPNRKISSNQLMVVKEEEKEKPEQEKSQAPYHVSIGLMVSPDFTGTTIKKGFESMGKTYGLGAEFYTGPKFRIKLSAISTEKIYSAEKGEYTVPGSYGYNSGIKPDKTDAVCNILEVPIFFQYNLWQLGKSSIWLSSGISSYWMRREEYKYTFNVAGQFPEGIVIEKENTHLLSVASIGFAYERQLNKHISLELEPYLKIPLGGIGYGKVTLYSSGAYFSFKYHIGK